MSELYTIPHLLTLDGFKWTFPPKLYFTEWQNYHDVKVCVHAIPHILKKNVLKIIQWKKLYWKLIICISSANYRHEITEILKKKSAQSKKMENYPKERI